MSITTTISRVMGNDPTEIPRWTQPMILNPEKCAPLGPPVGGRRWFDWPDQRLEVEEVGEPISPDNRAIPEGPLFKLWQDGGGYMLQPLRAHVRGTYAERTTVVARAVKQPKAQRPVDMLNAVGLLTGHTQHGKFAIRTVPSILARFKAKADIEFRSVGDGSDVMVTAPGGALLTAHRDDIALLSPLIVPFVLNGAVHCEVTKHREPVDAVTLAFAIPNPIPWCMECMPK